MVDERVGAKEVFVKIYIYIVCGLLSIVRCLLPYYVIVIACSPIVGTLPFMSIEFRGQEGCGCSVDRSFCDWGTVHGAHILIS